MKCKFCGSDHLPVTKYQCKGLDDGIETYVIIHMCICCDANTDNDWIAEQIGFDEVIEMKPI